MSVHGPRPPHRLRLPRQEERRPRAWPLPAVGEPAVRARVRQGRAAGAGLEGQAEAALSEDHQGGRGPGQEGRRATAGDMDRGARVAPHHRPRPSSARRAPRPLARGDPGRDARRQLQLLPPHPPDPRRPGPRPGARRQAHARAALDLLRGEDARQQEDEAARRDDGGPPPRDAQDRLQLGARGGAAPREPGTAREEPAGAPTEDAPRVEHGGDREHRDQGERPAGARRRRARRLLGPARGRDRGTPLERPRPHARLRHRLPHHRGGRRRHAARVPAEERQGARRAAARRRLRRAPRLARGPEGVPPGPGPGVERGRPRGPEEGRHARWRPRP